MITQYSVTALGQKHDRTGFECGIDALDRYLASQATQDVRRRVCSCFVATPVGSEVVAGFFTLAAASIPLADLAPNAAKRLPRYPLVAAVRIGRLAVAKSHQGKGLGASLLVDAMTRSIGSEIMAFAVVVDATNEAAAAFYRYNKFLAFESAPLSLYLPLADFARARTTVAK